MIGREIGPYRIIEKIGQGGMGIVFKGLHVKLEQEVAIKVLAPELSQDPSMRERFINEAKIQARISHPNVVNVLNYVEEGSNLFLVMEYIPGETLDTLLKRTGCCPNAVNVCISVLSALEFMHARGIVHRDIKPGNIMFLEDGTVKVMDFGIAKVAGERGQTKTGMRLGTLWYMSPEQIMGEETSVASDLYSVGVTLYQMLTGRIPFGGDSEYMVMKAHLEERPIPPWEINANVSRNMGAVILKSMAKNKGERYRSAREFADDLASAAGSPSAASLSPQASSSDSSPVPVARGFAFPGGAGMFSGLDRKIVLIILFCVGLSLVIIGIFLAFKDKKESVFPVTKSLPSVPSSLTSPQPSRIEGEPALPANPEGKAVVEVKTVPDEPLKKKERRFAKKKNGPARAEAPSRSSRKQKEESSRRSSEKSEEMDEWKVSK